jgi:5-methylcytosine-specific restriction endonuclease McrA
MNPQPKKKRKKLSPVKYHQVRVDLYNDQKEYCPICGCWMPFDLAHLHHKKSRGSGGGDDLENLVLICFKCHRKVHDGQKTID